MRKSLLKVNNFSLLKIFDNPIDFILAESPVTIVFQLEDFFTSKDFCLSRWINKVPSAIVFKSSNFFVDRFFQNLVLGDLIVSLYMSSPQTNFYTTVDIHICFVTTPNFSEIRLALSNWQENTFMSEFIEDNSLLSLSMWIGSFKSFSSEGARFNFVAEGVEVWL